MADLVQAQSVWGDQRLSAACQAAGQYRLLEAELLRLL